MDSSKLKPSELELSEQEPSELELSELELRALDFEKKEKLLLILGSLFTALLFDYLFYEKALGLSYPVFVIILLSFFWWSTRNILSVNKGFGWFVLIPILFLSATFAIYSNPVLAAINVLLIPLLIVVHTLLVTNKNSIWAELRFSGDIIKRITTQTMNDLPKPFLFLAKELKTQESGTTTRAVWKKIIIGLMISLPVMMLILPLLSSADMVFDYYLTRLTQLSTDINFESIVQQAIIISFVFIYLLGYLWSLHSNRTETESTSKKSTKAPVWDATILLTVLGVVNAVYLLFSIIQFTYLYGGDGHSLPSTFTYAEYARKGFFELVTVTIINLSVLLSSLKFVKKDNQTLYLAVRVLLSLLVVCSLNMLFSAHVKMSLYEQAYGLTYLRIFVHYFLGLLLVLFLLALSNIWLVKPPLVKAYIVVTLVFYTVLNYINVDIIIARNNIDLYFQTGKLDVYYLQGLSYDALPELTRLDKINNQDVVPLKEYLLTLKQDFAKPQPWQAYNYSRAKANFVLKQRDQD